jgi:uncharacterized protein YbjT (DUF2867 family)
VVREDGRAPPHLAARVYEKARRTMRVLVTGGTGYVGGRLVPRLLDRGHEVSCLVRDPGRLPPAWRERVRVATGSADDDQAVLRAAADADVAVYLVHGLFGSTRRLAQRESATAAAFRDGAELAGVRRIVYLGGLVDEEGLASTSEHLYARQQAGAALRDGPIPVTELRAGIVLGAASASFELLRMAAAQPVQLRPPWSGSRCQPIAEHDMLALLVAAIEDGVDHDEILDVGGPDVFAYGDLVALVREELGRRRAPRLRLWWLPPEAVALAAAARAGVDPALTLSLLGSARVDAVVRDHAAAERRFPGLTATPAAVAVRQALAERAAGLG